MKFKITLVVLMISFFGLIVFSRTNNNSQSNTQKNTFSDLVGKKAPNFELSAYDGSKVSLDNLKGKTIILFFNEGIVCYPACWNQVAALGTDNDLNSDSVATYSIVPDQQSQWDAAIRQQPDLGKEPLLIDDSLKMSQDYGVLGLSSSMHKGAKPGHTYVIIDKDGVVRYTYDDPTMGIQNNLLKQELAKL